MARIVGIVGSPREGGNTETLVRRALEAAESRGAETTLFHLGKMGVNPCKGCLVCKEKGRCVQEDDMAAIYEALHRTDGLVLGSPVYFATVSAQFKAFMDRLIALIDTDFRSRLPEGKRAVLLFCQGDERGDAYLDGLKCVETTCEWLGIEVVERIVASGVEEPGEVAENTEIMGRVQEAAYKLLQE